MQGNPQSTRFGRVQFPAPMLGHMPYHPEAATPGMLQDKLEAVKHANEDAALTNSRAVDSAMLIAKGITP